jgi:hypothetical protein
MKWSQPRLGWVGDRFTSKDMRRRQTSSVDFRHRQDKGSESRTDCFILDSRVAIVALMVMKYIILIPWGCRQN